MKDNMGQIRLWSSGAEFHMSANLGIQQEKNMTK